VPPVPWESPDEDATATINYTSGTTARPKGVQITHRNVWVNGVTFALHVGVTDRDVYLHTLPMFHANGWGMPFGLTGLGVPQVIIRKIDGGEILRRVERYGVTLMCAAPAVVTAVLDAAQTWDGPVPGSGRAGGARTRIVVAGAPPPSRTIQRVEEELGWEFLQIYGLTETSPLLTVNRQRAEEDDLPADERARRLGRAGMPALGTRISVSDQGEVLARGNTVLAGYWQQPEATADALEGDWFHTGDGGDLDDEGYLTIRDRKKDVIITGGENVSSIEVEDALFSHPAVAEVAVIGVPSEKWGETIKALVVLADGAEADEAGLIAHCRERLAHYKAPTSVEFREAIPRTATGKVQKFKLREQYWAGRARLVN
jgi:fatty-acyl-CoA synthase